MWKLGQGISGLPLQNQVDDSLDAQLRAVKACGHYHTGLARFTKPQVGMPQALRALSLSAFDVAGYG